MVWKLAQSPRRPTLYCAPGNGGIESLATCVPVKADDIAGLKAFVLSEKIDLTVVGPEARWRWASSTNFANPSSRYLARRRVRTYRSE